MILTITLATLCIAIGKTRNNDMIAFMAEVNNQTDIYLYDPLRQERFNITNTDYPEWSFGWSSSGALLFTAAVNPSQAADELFIMTRLGSHQVIETPDTLYSFGGVWSPDGDTLAYFSSHPSNYSDIYTITVPDLTVRNLTQTEALSESHPLWSPDGTQLLYLRDGNLYLFDLQSEESHLLLDMSLIIEMPVWSPNGQWIAFYIRNYVNGRNTLNAYIVSRDGQEVQRLTLPLIINSPVSWSPDSQQLALVAEDTTLIIYNIDSHSFERHFGENRRFAPQWSPDGRWIAFIENRQLNFYDVSTESIHSLPSDGQVKPPLVWRP